MVKGLGHGSDKLKFTNLALLKCTGVNNQMFCGVKMVIAKMGKVLKGQNKGAKRFKSWGEAKMTAGLAF